MKSLKSLFQNNLLGHFFLGVSYFKRQFTLLSQPNIFILKNDKEWYIYWTSKLPMGITVNSIINCTDGVEFDHGLLS